MTILQLFPDLICVAILLLFLVIGAGRGLFRTLSGLLSFLIALFGAKYLADCFAPLVADSLVPRLLPYITGKLTEAAVEGASSAAAEGGGLGILGLLPAVQELLDGAAGAMAEAMAPSIARAAAGALAWLALFLAGFLVLKLLCRLLRWMFDRIDQIPGLHLVNHAAGGVLGLLEGVLLLALAVSLLLFFGVLPQGLVEETWLLRTLAGVGPIH